MAPRPRIKPSNKPRNKDRDYINNDDLYKAIREYQIKCKEAEAAGKELPIVPNYIGLCFMKLADNIGRSRSFSGYSFLEEMKMDGVINCLKFMNNFDTDRFYKPFAYFTQIIWNSFLNRISIEKKQLYVTFKMSKELMASGETYSIASDELKLNLNTSAEYIDDYIEEYERKLAEKKARIQERADQKKKEKLAEDSADDEF